MHRIELDKARLHMEALIQTALDGEEVIITRDAEPVLKRVPCFKGSCAPKGRDG